MKHKKIWFWLLQVLGWGFIAVINGFGKAFSVPDLSKTYIFLEATSFFISGIIATLIIRKFLIKQLDFNQIQKREIKIVLITLFYGSVILFFLLTFLSTASYFIVHKKWVQVSALAFVSTLVNSVIFILFWLLFYLTIKITRQFRANKIKRIELENSLKESQLNMLIGQINPHFMFNSLNNIRALMLEDVTKSREMITRLSDMLRYSLTKNQLHKIPINEELEMVENYIALSKIQLENRLEYKEYIDTSLLNIEIPPMLIQMLIENAVKHGVSNLPNGGLILLEILKKENQLIIRVCNSGKLISNTNSTKIGLENIKKRLFLLFKDKATFSLSEKDNTVVAMIKIPLQNY